MLRRNKTDMKNTYYKNQVGKLIGAAFAATALVGTGGSLDAAGIHQKKKAPEGVSASDWRGIRAAYEEARHAIQELPDGGYAAQIPSQGWRTEFDGTGFVTTPRDGSWTWGLELRSIGEERVVALGRGTADENRLAFARSAEVFEWFVNRSGGLQQGWTIIERPDAGADRLGLELKVRGGLRARVGVTSVDFVDSRESVVLTYGGLLAWDAEGRKLPVEFAAADAGIRVEVDTTDAVFPVTVDPLAQEAHLKGFEPDTNDAFGASVAISGNLAVVGAPEENGAATGVNGDATDNSSGNAGAAYVFERVGGIWEYRAYLKASNPGANDAFGGSVGIAGGSTLTFSDDLIVVGARLENGSSPGIDGPDDNAAADAGAAYVFTRNGLGQWEFPVYLKADNPEGGDQFGSSVAVSPNRIIVGAPFEDSNTSGVDSVGNNAGDDTGAAYIFSRLLGGPFSQAAYVKASDPQNFDEFGASVAISGSRAVVGAPREDAGPTIDAGAAYVFSRDGLGNWSEDDKVRASNPGGGDDFGTSVAISGETLVVGAPEEDSGSANSGAAYVFVRDDIAGTWDQQAFLKPSTNNGGHGMGGAVGISGDVVIAGGEFEDSSATGINGNQNDTSLTSSGAAWVYRRNGVVWSFQAYLKASNTGFNDRFGRSVAISGELAIVGAPDEDSGSGGTPVNGLQFNNILNDSGKAYVYDLTPVSAVPDTSGDTTPPSLRVRGRKTIETLRKRVVFRGTASDASGIASIDVRAGGAKVAKTTLRGGKRWKTVLRVRKDRGRVIVKIRAIDNAGNLSKRSKVRILRR